MNKTKIISVANHKGGVGKSTTVASVGVGLARKGFKVLLVDLDAQANLTSSLLEEEPAMNVPCPPLVIDTISVMPIEYYGFSVISDNNENILSSVKIEGDTVRLSCSRSPHNCRIRYAVNGERMKSGNRHGPRGNIRDHQGNAYVFCIEDKQFPVHNWCYQFDILCP